MDSQVVTAAVVASMPNIVAVVWFAATMKATQKAHTRAIENSDQGLRILTTLYNDLHTRVTVLEDRQEREAA
jgi:hypothetical protein